MIPTTEVERELAGAVASTSVAAWYACETCAELIKIGAALDNLKKVLHV